MLCITLEGTDLVCGLSFLDFIDKHQEYVYYGTSLHNAISINEVTIKKPLALILGNEGSGVNKDILNKTTNNIYIPINDTESLNVSIAGSILMYLLNK